jgi:hypothetical protein
VLKFSARNVSLACVITFLSCFALGALGQPLFGACDNKCRDRHSFYGCSSGGYYYFTDNELTCTWCTFQSGYRCAFDSGDSFPNGSCSMTGFNIELTSGTMGTLMCSCASPALAYEQMIEASTVSIFGMLTVQLNQSRCR